MLSCPSYGKVINLGNPMTENALIGEVIVQEKLDGSQFRWGVNEDGILVIGSRKKDITDDPDGLFISGWDYLRSIEETILKYPKNTYFFGEYMKTAQHNTLKYDAIPTNHIMLFDCIKDGKYVDKQTLEFIAKDLNIDVVPELYKGTITVDGIKELLALAKPYLGGEMIEGVVVKNYTQTILLGGSVFPLFTKYVQPAFREKHMGNKEFQPKVQFMEELKEELRNPNRWEKAYQHLKEVGELTGELRDIPTIMNEVKKDIEEEEKEYIKERLYKKFSSEIIRNSVRGLPEWLKEKLLENVKENKTEDENTGN